MIRDKYRIWKGMNDKVLHKCQTDAARLQLGSRSNIDVIISELKKQ